MIYLWLLFKEYFGFYFLIFLLIPIIILYLTTRLIVYILAWYLERNYGTKIKVNSVKFFQLDDITIQLSNGLTIACETAYISNRLFVHRQRSLISICLNGLRIQGDLPQLNEQLLDNNSDNDFNLKQSQVDQFNLAIENFLKKIRSYQFLSLLSFKCSNFSFNQLGITNFKVKCLVNTTIQDFEFYFESFGKTITTICSLNGINFKLLNHGSEETCLADLSFSIKWKLKINSTNIIESELNLDLVQLILFDGLPAFTSQINKTRNSPIKNVNKYNRTRFLQILLDLNIKKLSFIINNFSIQIMKDHGQRVLSTRLDKIEAELEKTAVRGLEFKLNIKELQSNSRHITLCKINEISFFIQINQDGTFLHFLNLFILSEINSCIIDYNETEINYWLNYLKLFKSTYKLDEQKFKQIDNQQFNFIDQYLIQNPPYIRLNISTEINNLEFSFHPTLSAVKLFIVLDRCKLSNMINPDPLLKEMSCECLIDSLCCYKSIRHRVAAFEIERFDSIDHKDIPFYLNNIIFKMHYTSLIDLKINCVLNIISINLDYIYNVIDHFINKLNLKRQEDEQSNHYSNQQQQQDNHKNGLQLKIQLNVNSLALFSDEIKANVSTLLFDYDLSKLSLTLNQFEVFSLIPLIISEETQPYRIMEVFEFKFMRNMDLKEIMFTFSEEIYFQWTVSFHIKTCNLINKLKRIKSHFKTRSIVRHSESIKRKSLFNVLKIRLDGNIRLGALLSNENKTMQLCTSKASFTYYHKTKFNCNIESLIWKFDQNDIFDIKQINFVKYPEFESQKLIDRLQTDRFKLESKKNVCLTITVGQIDIKFPYKYDFATTFNEHFITITKWIRLYHKKHPTIDEIRQSSISISQDILININKINLIILDDPFEKNLHVNYCLLEDEYHEGLKRRDCLTKKIAQVKQQKNLSKEKIEELYNALELKQEMIYIERQVLLKKNVNYSLSSPLFTLHLSNLNLTAMADLTLNTKDKLFNLIRNELDKPNICTTDVQFSTIWGRIINIKFDKLEGLLRDFKRPMIKVDQMRIFGLLIGAEQEANSRAKRNCYVDTTPFDEPILLLRSMTTLKFFHDLEFDADQFIYTHGTCWEAIIQQLNISFESIIKSSSDPSPALPWFDKMRFLFHGLVRLKSNKFALAFHGSQNPYNQTEFIEIAFSNSILVWQIGKITIFGNLDLFVHTESKYDERRILHIPNVKINIDLNWICLGNQFDHYSVMPCAANKVPEYSSNHVHDSYRAFRSQNLSVNISIETEQQFILNSNNNDIPNIIVYSSTLRWFEKQKFIFTGYSKLTRRGKLFNNTKPRKQAFTRMFKKIRLTICLHKLKLAYFSSFSKEYGIEIIGGYLSHSGEHKLSFVPFKDNLKRRPRPVWETVYMNSELCNVEIWLHRNVCKTSLIGKPLVDLTFVGLLSEDKSSSGSEDNLTNQKPADKFYFLSFTRMCYHRESINTTITSESIENEENPIHSLVIHDLKGAWTKDNRDVAVSLFELFIKTEQLRRNLSTDALKGFKFEEFNSQSGPSPNKSKFHQPNTSSPASTMNNRGHAASMLQKLISDTENNANIVYIEEMESEISNEEPKLKGIVACSDDDVIRKNLLIELVNSQVMLRGIETHGYIIVSAANTRILQKHHKAVWKERTLYSKTTWVGSVECMQYYATMDSVKNDDIVWLSIDNIQQKNNLTISQLPDLVGSGQSAGGVVTAAIVNPNMNSEESSKTSVELQRIISRCGCQFYYVNFGEDLDSETQDIPPLPDDNNELLMEPWDRETVVDSFTFTHPELNISTNSQQFSMIMDIINNLLCYVEQHRKEAHEKLQRMRFRMLLSSLEEQKGPILKNQNLLREEVRNRIFLERTNYAIHKEALDELRQNGEISARLNELRFESEQNIEACKTRIDKLNEELSMLISTFKEAQITEDKIKEREAAAQENGNNFISSVVRRIEICFKQASWRLTDSTGQLGIAEMELSNFLYTKVAKNDDSVDHTLELGYIKVHNLLPNQEYKVVLQPTKPKCNIPLDHHRALRVFCRESPPVGGISIKEHFEINVIPLTIEVTNAFYKEMFKFFFPERYGISLDLVNEDDNQYAINQAERKQQRRNRKKEQDQRSFTALQSMNSSRKSKEDIEEKMRQRASKNQNFVYIKIPEVPIRVSYKGNKDKNFEVLNIRDFTFLLPTIEYHNQNWTWLDVSMAIKSEFKRRLLPQAFKQKLKPSFFSSTSNSGLKQSEIQETQTKDPKELQTEEDEQKARLLLGELAVKSASSQTLEKSSRFKGSGFIFGYRKH